MQEAIGQMLPMAVGVAVSPMPIVAVVLMLVTPRARVNGPAFLAGWLGGIAVVGSAALVLAGPADASENGQPADWVSWLKLALGVALLLVAVKQWRNRPRPGEEAALPKWMGAIDRFTPTRSFAIGIGLGSINPKNLLFILGGAAAIAQTGISAGEQAVSWLVFTALASIGVAAPVVLYLGLGERADRFLAELKDWLARNNTAIMAVLCLIVGVKLIGDGIAGF